MLKRKDWHYFKDREGIKKSKNTGTDDDSDSEASASSQSSEEADLQEAGSELAEENAEIRRIEDLSEDDFDSDVDDLGAQAVALKEQWLSASKDDAAKLPRAALACRLCKGVLMLGPASLRQHIASKKHNVRLQRKAKDYEAICFATGHVDDSTVETHQERLQRTRDAVKATADKKTRRSEKREQKARKSSGKPGKRERAELRGAESGRTKKKPSDSSLAVQAKKIQKINGKQKAPSTVEGAKEEIPESKVGELQTSKYWSSPAPKKSKPKQKPQHKKKKSAASSGTEHKADRSKRQKKTVS